MMHDFRARLRRGERLLGTMVTHGARRTLAELRGLGAAADEEPR